MKVYFWEFRRKNETERLRTLFMPEGGVKLKNLTGYTTYMISVAPFNAAGDGPRSPPTRGRTQQAGMYSYCTNKYANSVFTPNECSGRDYCNQEI